jgi:hypothetical protein
MLMTLAEYARHRGCDKKAVQSAIERGRIKHNEDGSIDSDRADLEGKQHAHGRCDPKSPRSQTISSTHAGRDPTVDIAADTRRRKQPGEPDGSGFDFFNARTVKAVNEPLLKGIALPTFDCFRVPGRSARQLAAESEPLKKPQLHGGRCWRGLRIAQAKIFRRRVTSQEPVPSFARLRHTN